MFKVKVISSLQNVLPKADFESFKEVKKLKGLKGERVSFQILSKYSLEEGSFRKKDGFFTLRSPFGKNVKTSVEGFVPVGLPCYSEHSRGAYLSKEPGLFPDVLYPIAAKERMYFKASTPTVLMVTVDIPEDFEAGEYSVNFCFHIGEEKHSVKVLVEVCDAVIKKNDLMFTQWFHCDSIADYHGVKMMSKRHWALIDEYIKTAARTGINMILTPILTPPLDTEIGTERPTMQLVGIKKTGDRYEFDFTLLEKWVGICKKHGIEYFEMSHLFTQWGVKCCPKVVVEIEGKKVKEFGWHTASMSDGYKNFLSQFLPALTAKLKGLGIADKTYFHISDEPGMDPEKPDLENYKAAKTFIKKYLNGFKLIDAISNIEFYKTGLISVPVVSTNHIEPFMKEDIKERWCYYCCGQGDDVSNRFIAMPSFRNRIIGTQMFQSDISGFLQWGYNFYYTEKALYKIDPYGVTDGEQAWPAGDPFSVYPYGDRAIESLRTVVFYEALQDRMLLKMLSEKIGLENAKKWVGEEAGMDINFKEYPETSEFLETMHDKIIEKLTEK